MLAVLGVNDCRNPREPGGVSRVEQPVGLMSVDDVRARPAELVPEPTDEPGRQAGRFVKADDPPSNRLHLRGELAPTFETDNIDPLTQPGSLADLVHHVPFQAPHLHRDHDVRDPE